MGRPKGQKLTKQQRWELANKDFCDSVVSLSSDKLSGMLSMLSKNQEEVRESLEAALEPGEALYQAKAEYNQLKGPFADAKKLLREKTKYVYSLLKARGA